jgi:hypothetical protein
MKKPFRPIANIAPIGIAKLILLATFSTCILYNLYYLISPWIWSQNTACPVDKLTPWMISWTKEHDGIEIYALYIFMFINIIFTFLLVHVSKLFSKAIMHYGLIFVLIIISAWYCLSIKFFPPMSSINKSVLSFFGVAVAVPLLLTVLYLQKIISALWEILIAFLILIPVCFIATSPIYAIDYSYIFLPAQKLMDGFAISDVYFQYDVFLSFLAMGWMKLGLNLWQFQFLGQLSYFVAILTIYLISRKLFYRKSLCLLLLCSLILVRFYTSPVDIVQSFQVTPLRLDLWLVLFVMVFFLGAFHWSIGFVCGLLIIFHRTFGIIYSIAYIQLILTLGIIYVTDNRNIAGRIDVDNIVCYLKKVVIPLVFIILSYCVAQILFSRNADATAYYQKMGIGFMPISKTSFFWYYPIVMSAAFTLLNALRNQATCKYITLGFLLLYCTIGNSVYFFGRSHEHNILNISILLVFLFFYSLDLIDRKLNNNSVIISRGSLWRKHVISCFGIFFIASVVYCYTGNITKKLGIQFNRARALSFHQDASYSDRDNRFLGILKEVKLATNDSKTVQIFDSNAYTEFLFYHFGEYKNMAFFSPTTSWIFLDELIQHMQGLIDRGYYLLLPVNLYKSLFMTRLLNADWVYYTNNKNYILIAALRDSPKLRSQTVLSEGIIFNRKSYPDFISNVKDISDKEACGH